MRRAAIPLVAFAILISAPSGSEHVQARPVGFTVTFDPGWNLIGGPAGTTLFGASATLYTRQYRDDGYQTVNAPNGLTGGLGYWAYFPSGGSATLPDGGPCVIAVPIGAQEWVMVGNPWPWTTTTVRGAERVYTYDPATGYTSGVTVRPGHAAWAYSSVATTVALVVDGCPTASSVPPSPPQPPPGN